MTWNSCAGYGAMVAGEPSDKTATVSLRPAAKLALNCQFGERLALDGDGFGPHEPDDVVYAGGSADDGGGAEDLGVRAAGVGCALLLVPGAWQLRRRAWFLVFCAWCHAGELALSRRACLPRQGRGCFVLCALCFVLCALCGEPGAWSLERGAWLARRSLVTEGGLARRSPQGEGGCVVAAAPPSGADAPSLVLGLRLRRCPWRRSLVTEGGLARRSPQGEGGRLRRRKIASLQDTRPEGRRRKG